MEFYPLDQIPLKEKIHYCFFSHSYCITNKDSEKRQKEDWEKYELDKKDPECSYATFNNTIKHKFIIWDGKEEHIIDTNIEIGVFAKFHNALIFLNSNAAIKDKCCIKNGYDYAWVFTIIKKQDFLGHTQLYFKSTPDFVDTVHSFNLPIDIASVTVIDKYLKRVYGGTLPLHFNDHCGITESNRRNLIAMTFYYLMQEI